MKHNRFGYFLKEGIHSIVSHGFMSFASVFVIVACLIIMGCFALLTLNVDSIIDDLEQENQMVAFVDERYSESDAIAIKGRVENVPNVKEVVFITNEQAMVSFLEQYEDSSLLDNLDASVLRHRYVVYLKDLSRMEETQNALLEVDGIVKVNAHLGIAEGFANVKNIITAVSVVLVAILFVISLFIMANTIRLTTISRREEIAVMKMVGATNSFIRQPFLIEGLILGIMGALIAFVIQWGVYSFVVNKIAEMSSIAFIETIPFSVVAIPMLLVFLTISVIVGALGSTSAIKNYLKV